MPARTPVRRTGSDLANTGGFGGFTGFESNPTIRYPGGRVLASDVRQAADAMNLGGMPTTVARGPTVTVGGRTGPGVRTAGVTPAATLRSDPSGAGLTPSELGGETLRSLPNDRFVSLVNNGDRTNTTDETYTEPTIASRGGRSPLFVTDPKDDWVGVEHPGGEPQVEIARADARPPGSRSVPGRDMSGFGGNMTIGQFLNTPLAFLRLGGGYPSTTAPADRGSVFAGAGIAGTYNSTLGTWDSFDAAGNLVRVAGPPPPGWSGSTASNERPNSETPVAEAEAQGARETAVARANGQLPPAQQPAGSLATVLQSFPSLNNPAGVRALQSGAAPSDLLGRSQFDSRAANLMLMAAQSDGGGSNFMRNTSDRGHDEFYPGSGVMGWMDEEGTIVPISTAQYRAKLNEAKAAQRARGIIGDPDEHKKYVKRMSGLG